MSFTVPGAGTAVLTRVRNANGTEYAEIRMRVQLPSDEASARTRLTALLNHLRTLIGPARPGLRPHRPRA